MILLLLLVSLALADDDIHAVNEGETVEVSGPAVWMTEDRFRQYVADSRKLPVCTEALDKAIDLSIEANERALRATEVARSQFDEDEALIDEQVQTIATQAVRIDNLAGKVMQLQSQRNAALGVAVGFLSASTAATVLALTN